MPIAVGALYVRKYFGEESRREAIDVVDTIRNEFENTLSQVTWMDAGTKKTAIAKAQAIVEHIGYPDELTDDAKLEEYYAPLELVSDNYLLNSQRLRKFSDDYGFGQLREAVNKTDWVTHAFPAVVNAFYSPVENSIRE